MKNLFNMKKSAATKTAVQMTASQKKTTTVANISGKVKTAAFGVATGAGIAGTMMLQNEKGIRNRKAREAYHKRVEQVCTVAVGAAVVGATAAVVQGIFDPIVDVSMLEIEPASYLELNNKAVELDGAGTCSDSEEPAEEAETVEAEIVSEHDAAVPASAPEAEKPIVEATATEVQTEAPVDPAPVAPQAEQPAAPEAVKPAAEAPAAKQPADPVPVAPQTEQPAAPAPKDATPAPKAEQPADSASAAQTNQGDNAQQPKSKTGKQQPKDNGQGASSNNGQNGNNKNANAAK